ncbi:MAG: polyamine ABC transporter permease [Acidiferrobacteraceae bacterium]|nr:polyamine ABC transporter permease [Acidiferrobacteraceae bacterium]|tara:strand:+ start:2219 stop:3097 length:879 start_codon:yes stop_codon:yes gene_type:complete
MSLPAYTGPVGRIWHAAFIAICCLVFIFLMAPILVIVPLSFNAEPYFTFTPAMLRLDPEAFSFRWYLDVLGIGEGTGANRGYEWAFAARNSLFIAFFATLLATALGTLAAVGLSRTQMPFRKPIMALLISPLIVPIIIIAAGMFFFYSKVGLAYSHLGVILAHAAIGTPYVVITVTATMVGFDETLIRASASLGAKPLRTFFRVIMPLITPGVISGALFAFITSFDEVVLIYFLADAEQKTIPIQMWSGLRQQISPSILAVATLLITFSVILLVAVELLRRRSERLRTSAVT